MYHSRLFGGVTACSGGFGSAFNGGFGVSQAGLGTMLALFGVIARMFSGQYPEDIFKLVVGINRWSYRVAAYAGLMTDEYPPFRFWD